MKLGTTLLAYKMERCTTPLTDSTMKLGTTLLAYKMELYTTDRRHNETGDHSAGIQDGTVYHWQKAQWNWGPLSWHSRWNCIPLTEGTLKLGTTQLAFKMELYTTDRRHNETGDHSAGIQDGTVYHWQKAQWNWGPLSWHSRWNCIPLTEGTMKLGTTQLAFKMELYTTDRRHIETGDHSAGIQDGTVYHSTDSKWTLDSTLLTRENIPVRRTTRTGFQSTDIKKRSLSGLWKLDSILLT